MDSVLGFWYFRFCVFGVEMRRPTNSIISPHDFNVVGVAAGDADILGWVYVLIVCIYDRNSGYKMGTEVIEALQQIIALTSIIIISVCSIDKFNICILKLKSQTQLFSPHRPLKRTDNKKQNFISAVLQKEVDRTTIVA